jgi:hypothetical protein
MSAEQVGVTAVHGDADKQPLVPVRYTVAVAEAPATQDDGVRGCGWRCKQLGWLSSTYASTHAAVGEGGDTPSYVRDMLMDVGAGRCARLFIPGLPHVERGLVLRGLLPTSTGGSAA